MRVSTPQYLRMGKQVQVRLIRWRATNTLANKEMSVPAKFKLISKMLGFVSEQSTIYLGKPHNAKTAQSRSAVHSFKSTMRRSLIYSTKRLWRQITNSSKVSKSGGQSKTNSLWRIYSCSGATMRTMQSNSTTRASKIRLSPRITSTLPRQDHTPSSHSSLKLLTIIKLTMWLPRRCSLST